LPRQKKGSRRLCKGWEAFRGTKREYPIKGAFGRAWLSSLVYVRWMGIITKEVQSALNEKRVEKEPMEGKKDTHG